MNYKKLWKRICIDLRIFRPRILENLGKRVDMNYRWINRDARSSTMFSSWISPTIGSCLVIWKKRCSRVCIYRRLLLGSRSCSLIISRGLVFNRLRSSWSRRYRSQGIRIKKNMGSLRVRSIRSRSKRLSMKGLKWSRSQIRKG